MGRYTTDRSYVTQRYGVPAGWSLPDGAESPGFHGQVGRQGVHLLQGKLYTEIMFQFVPGSDLVNMQLPVKRGGKIRAKRTDKITNKMSDSLLDTRDFMFCEDFGGNLVD